MELEMNRNIILTFFPTGIIPDLNRLETIYEEGITTERGRCFKSIPSMFLDEPFSREQIYPQ
jgi:hypothetical protein